LLSCVTFNASSGLLLSVTGLIIGGIIVCGDTTLTSLGITGEGVCFSIEVSEVVVN